MVFTEPYIITMTLFSNRYEIALEFVKTWMEAPMEELFQKFKILCSKDCRVSEVHFSKTTTQDDGYKFFVREQFSDVHVVSVERFRGAFSDMGFSVHLVPFE